MNRMSPLDALFLHAEDGISHMHIGSCALFHGPPPAMDEWRRLVESKLHLVRRFRQKVRFVPGGLGRPVWVDDQAFDLGFHLRRTALPAPGDEGQLHRLVGRLMSHELDRTRPLWEMWLVEGLEHGNWAVVSKVHHCMVDGISGTDLMASLMDRTPDTTVTDPVPWSPEPEPNTMQLTVDALGELAMIPPRLLLSVARSAGEPRRALDHLADAVDGLRSFGQRIRATTPALSIEGTIGRHRRWAVARTTLADVKFIREAFGGSVNDVVLAAITTGFRELLIRRGDPVDGVVLRSLVPVSVRSEHDHSHNNQVSMMIAELPIGVPDLVDRLHAVSDHMRALKASHQADAGTVAFDAAQLLPPALFALGAHAAMSILRRTPQHTINTVTTNVPGPPFSLYMLGREMIEYAPFVPLSEGVRIGVAILSYNGRICFGITGDYDAAPDVEFMAEQIDLAIRDLVLLASSKRTAVKSTPAKRTPAKRPPAKATPTKATPTKATSAKETHR